MELGVHRLSGKPVTTEAVAPEKEAIELCSCKKATISFDNHVKLEEVVDHNS